MGAGSPGLLINHVYSVVAGIHQNSPFRCRAYPARVTRQRFSLGVLQRNGDRRRAGYDIGGRMCCPLSRGVFHRVMASPKNVFASVRTRTDPCIIQSDMLNACETKPPTDSVHGMAPLENHPGRGWRARLHLEYAAVDGHTRLVKREHDGPLMVQKALYPEGPSVCHSLILHPPSGIVGGDRLAITAVVNADAHALITMPGATRWYRSLGEPAVQTIDIRVGRGGVFEWLPPETIIFDQAHAQLNNRVLLEAGARYTGWEIICLGRTASGEQFKTGRLRQRTEIRLDGKALWDERANVIGGSPLMHSPAGLAAAPVTATLLAAGVPIPADVMARCREIAVGGNARAGVSTMESLLVARYLGASSEEARNYFVALWRILRPLLAGRAAVTPRIWTT